MLNSENNSYGWSLYGLEIISHSSCWESFFCLYFRLLSNGGAIDERQRGRTHLSLPVSERTGSKISSNACLGLPYQSRQHAWMADSKSSGLPSQTTMALSLISKSVPLTALRLTRIKSGYRSPFLYPKPGRSRQTPCGIRVPG